MFVQVDRHFGISVAGIGILLTCLPFPGQRGVVIGLGVHALPQKKWQNKKSAICPLAFLTCPRDWSYTPGDSLEAFTPRHPTPVLREDAGPRHNNRVRNPPTLLLCVPFLVPKADCIHGVASDALLSVLQCCPAPGGPNPNTKPCACHHVRAIRASPL